MEKGTQCHLVSFGVRVFSLYRRDHDFRPLTPFGLTFGAFFVVLRDVPLKPSEWPETTQECAFAGH